MLPITAWKSVLAITALLAVPAAIILPAKHAAVPDSAFTARQEADGPIGTEYAKPSPFTVPPPQTHRRQKAAAVAAPPELPSPAR